MRTLYHLVLVISVLTVYYSVTSAYQVPEEFSLTLAKDNHEETLRREKRQMESFDEYPAASNQDTQEEPGFWDRIVKVAIKLFSKFVEWLNS